MKSSLEQRDAGTPAVAPACRTAARLPDRSDRRRGSSRTGRPGRARLTASFLSLWLLAFAVLATFACVPGAARAAGATGSPSAPVPGAATPVLPALQSLISSATASAAVSASAPDAASAPSPASEAEFARSLDSVISTLDNDRQRRALVAQLKKLRDVSQHAAPPAAASSAQGAAGLLGAIASGLASVAADVHQGRTPARYWSGRINAAANELYAIVASQGSEHFGKVVLDMLAMLAGWGACAGSLIWLQRRLHARFGIVEGLKPNPATRELLIFALRRVGPWVVAFVAALAFVRAMPEALGRTLGMVIAYAIVAGAVFSAICLIMFSLFGSGHRRAAVHVLLRDARRLLFAIGVCGALGDAAVNYDVAHQLGPNLAGLVSTVANMTAAVLTAYFALAFRQPVAHLIRNRSYEQRHDHRAATEGFEVLASLWHLPMLLLAGASIVATLGGLDSSEDVLQISVVTALLLVIAFFLSAIVLRVTRPRLHDAHRRRRHRSPYLWRLLRFAGTLVMLFVWLAFLEFSSRLWGVSLAGMIEDSVTARGIAHAVTAILTTVFVAWLIWILVDTAIQEALNPGGPRSKSRNPGTRARTMLPLVRNALAVTILTIAGIVTAANLGINVTPLLAGAGVIGLAVGFGAQSLVTDLITGLFIILEDTISVGDWIEIDGGHAGTVEHLTIRTVRLRDGQGAIHAIPFSQIKIVKNLSRDFAYAVFEVRVPFSADVDMITALIREVGADLAADFRYRNEMLGPVEVWGLDRFDPNWMVVKGQIKTRPLQQWSVARAFNVRLKRRMDEAGIEIPVPQMQVYTSSKTPGRQAEGAGDKSSAIWRETDGAQAHSQPAAGMSAARPPVDVPQAQARDVSHEPRPAPAPTGGSMAAPPQIPVAGDAPKG